MGRSREVQCEVLRRAEEGCSSDSEVPHLSSDNQLSGEVAADLSKDGAILPQYSLTLSSESTQFQSSATPARRPVSLEGSPVPSPVLVPVLDMPSSTSSQAEHTCQDPVCAASHLQLLGESLYLIGQHLLQTDKSVCLHRSLFLLLDSLMCSMVPLICLTSQVPELRSSAEYTLASSLENIAYLMPGL
ncbi:HMG box-containing protein 4-like [Synchiropus splendidus]|uniref:HMG box-containing protein 4-like n=1 Tax=Synchiropus splendidus TaxID=270530 RepID=UPI00237E2A5A|nr:HMG box-containing protein 4-like [Synchiropus splendidus]